MQLKNTNKEMFIVQFKAEILISCCRQLVTRELIVPLKEHRTESFII